MKRHIVYITGTRADYGLMRHTLRAIHKHPRLKLSIVATGMHLMPEFGSTIRQVKKDGFKLYPLPAVFKTDTSYAMAEFLGVFLTSLVPLLKKVKPDIIVVLGDRAEMLAGAAAGTYLGIPVAHLHGGEVTSTVDEAARHAITKLAQIHFPATRESAQRIIRLGENKKHVFVVGAPGLDALKAGLCSAEFLSRRYGLDVRRPFLLVTQHPVTQEIKQAAGQMQQTMQALIAVGVPALIVYPNADAGGRRMIEVIKKHSHNYLFRIFKSIPHQEYLSLMRYAAALVGNSSSGIIEAPACRLPVVNIGSRQSGRQRAGNVIDVTYHKDRITAAIKKALYDQAFRRRVAQCRNPYGDGRTGPRIARILGRIKIGKELLQKKITY